MKIIGILLIALGVLVLAFIGVYIGFYRDAVAAAENWEFSKADEKLFLKQVTELHDSGLLEYIEAGEAFEQNDYTSAVQKLGSYFKKHNPPFNTNEIWNEALYRYALQFENDGSYDFAIRQFEVLAEKGYRDSTERILEIKYREACGYFDSKQIREARKLFKELAGQGYKDSEAMLDACTLSEISDMKENEDYLGAYDKLSGMPQNGETEKMLSELKDVIYRQGVELYRIGDYRQARDCFQKVKPYDRSEAYETLCNAHLYTSATVGFFGNELIDIIGLEDAAEIIMSNWNLAKSYILGNWKGGKYYLKLSAKNNRSNMVDNLPRYKSADWFDVEDGYMISADKKNGKTVKLFKVTILDRDTIEVMSTKNNETYTLYRQ